MPADRQLDPQRFGDHLDRLYRAAWALSGSREDAEDLVQETFAQVLKRPRLLRSDDDLGYLLRALRHTFYSSRRAAQRRPMTSSPDDGLEVLEDQRAIRAESRLEAQELYRAIAALPEDFRDAVVAVDLLGLSYREAAGALKVREATLTTRLHRGRQRIVAALSADDAHRVGP